MGGNLSNSKQYKKLYPLVNLYLLSIKKKYIKIDTINAPGDAITAILNHLLALSMWKNSPYDNFFSTNIICDICDKYEL